MTTVRLANVHKDFKGAKVIKGVDLEIKSGEFMVFVGPSGCGKSTLLRLISGLEDISAGDMFFDDEKVNLLSPSNRSIAMVFQSYALYPHMDVRNNIAFGMKLAGNDKAEVERRVMEAAEMLQITELLDRLPRQLSGGQRQRVAIGRAIVRNPRVFLFDEPLSNLDAALRVATRIEIANLNRKLADTTMIYVTHDQVEAMTLADRICVLNAGLVEQVGTPAQLYSSPASIFVAGFIGSPKMNFLHGRHAEPHAAHTIGVRPEHLHLETASPVWQGPVIHKENVGADNYIYLDIGDEEPLVVRAAELQTGIEPGDTVGVAPENKGRIHRFDAGGKSI